MKRSPRARRALLVGGAAVVGVAGLLLARQIPFFRVRRVEIVGVRYLDPARVLAALALAADQNLFDPLGDATERLRGLEGIEAARIDRRVPATLRVRVVERPPAALVSTRDGMVVLDCAGRPMPYDPARSGLTLPLVTRADTVLVRALCTVRLGDSALYDEVDVVRPDPGGVILDLGRQRVRLRSVPTTDEVRAVGLVRRHLQATGRGFDELDGRFADRVYVRQSAHVLSSSRPPVFRT
jgi:cell division protein FtsQ